MHDAGAIVAGNSEIGVYQPELTLRQASGRGRWRAWLLVMVLIYLLLAGVMALLSIGVWVANEPRSYRENVYQQAQSRYLSAISVHKHQATLVFTAIILAIALCIAQVFAPTWFSYQTGVVNFLVAGLAVFAISNISKMLRQAPGQEPVASGSTQKALAWLLVSLGEPLRDFFNRNGVKVALSLLLFVVLFKMGEAILGRMSIVFYNSF